MTSNRVARAIFGAVLTLSPVLLGAFAVASFERRETSREPSYLAVIVTGTGDAFIMDRGLTASDCLPWLAKGVACEAEH